jgi:hypothetical protein
MPADEKAHPVHLNFFCAEAIVHVADALAQLIEQAGGLQGWGAGFDGKFIPGFLSSVSACRPDCKPLSGEFCEQINTQQPEYFARLAVYITLGI